MTQSPVTTNTNIIDILLCESSHQNNKTSIKMVHADLFYQPPKGEKSGLPHDPFKSFVVPRPIGWISTKSRDGKDNLAPFSQFTNVSFDPPTIM
jgi:flavin reductase (DIM6/NTAB) family NADH-FMN oxidoreductase RutF